MILTDDFHSDQILLSSEISLKFESFIHTNETLNSSQLKIICQNYFSYIENE